MSRNLVIIFFSCAVGLLFSFPLLTNALTVGPAKLEYQANPGDVISGNLFVFNESDQAITLYPSFEKFTEKNGERQFIPNAPTDLSDWFKTASSVTLKAKERRDLPFTINVPKDASPGGHYAVIWWSATPPAGPGGSKEVAIITRAGILVYLRVAGDVVESGEITAFNTDSGSRLFFGFPIGFGVSFKNNGTVHLTPGGNIEIKSILGQTVKTLAVNQYGVIILPDSEKGLGVVPWDFSYAFGPYQATLNLNYGESNKTASQNIWIFVFEWHVLTLIILGLFLLIYVLPWGVRKYNRWILSKYSKR